MLNLKAFDLRILQMFTTLLALAKAVGITDVVALGRIMQSHIDRRAVELNRERMEERRVVKRGIEQKKKAITHSISPKEKAVKVKGRSTQKSTLCPECRAGYLQIKIGEEGVYTACPACYKAKLF